MKKLLIILSIMSPLLANAAADYKVTFHNGSKNATQITLNKAICMSNSGLVSFPVSANGSTTINITDSNGAVVDEHAGTCLDRDKYIVWSTSNSAEIKFWHGKRGSFMGIFGSWYTSISGNIQSASCDGKDCTNKETKSSGDFSVDIYL